MSDFRIDESAPEHRKLRAAGLPAAGLWAMGGAYAMRELTDGWVPAYWVATWPAGKRHAAVLVRVGLWYPEDRDGIPGYAFHDWGSYQRPSRKITEQRRKARDRMSALRSATTDRSSSSPATRSRSPDVRANMERTHRERSQPVRSTFGERSENVRNQFGDSLALAPGGYFEGGSYGGYRAREGEIPPENALTSENPPSARCPQHRDDDRDPGPCGACKQARQRREQHDRQQRERRSADASNEARERARLRAAAIADCPMCDESGYLSGATVCSHDVQQVARNRRGAQQAREALREARSDKRGEAS